MPLSVQKIIQNYEKKSKSENPSEDIKKSENIDKKNKPIVESNSFSTEPNQNSNTLAISASSESIIELPKPDDSKNIPEPLSKNFKTKSSPVSKAKFKNFTVTNRNQSRSSSRPRSPSPRYKTRSPQISPKRRHSGRQENDSQQKRYRSADRRSYNKNYSRDNYRRERKVSSPVPYRNNNSSTHRDYQESFHDFHDKKFQVSNDFKRPESVSSRTSSYQEKPTEIEKTFDYNGKIYFKTKNIPQNLNSLSKDQLLRRIKNSTESHRKCALKVEHLLESQERDQICVSSLKQNNVNQEKLYDQITFLEKQLQMEKTKSSVFAYHFGYWYSFAYAHQQKLAAHNVVVPCYTGDTVADDKNNSIPLWDLFDNRFINRTGEKTYNLTTTIHPNADPILPRQ